MNENYHKNKFNHTIGLGLLIFILLIIITLILRLVFEDSKWYFETFTQPFAVFATGWFIQKGIANEQNKINNNHQQEKCLKDYLQEIKELTINEKLGTKDAKKEVIEVARIITESTIRNLDGKRNASLTYFLSKLTLTKKTYNDEPNFLTLLRDLNWDVGLSPTL
ncbi:MAG: hypothetical protein QNJ64_00615 [Crocosphaera sp.]|nr:hypothetical protein [Crocosphaera sp.]